MFARLVSLAVAVAAASTLIACTAEPAPTSTSRGASTEADEVTAEAAESSSSGTKAGGDGAASGKGAPTELPPADPDCLAACNASDLKTRCDGDEAFCEETCAYWTKAEVDCLIARTSCEKPDYVACQSESGEESGGGSK